ncbi:MAG: ribosomal RNA small subunit methyltransferase A [Elusimicrobia bacterium RIFOXYB2_FULL_62_6]|nr:MAG: ribosomal RNA small subunit methyltransferase A [Elusimicrobia bacterium RIFOXYB2_FULL_62_6]
MSPENRTPGGSKVSREATAWNPKELFMPKYSQVFLQDREMCELIATELAPEEFNGALEIGPGRGAITEFLYPLWNERLSLVEIDPALAARMRAKFPAARVHNADFLEFDLAANLAGGGRTAFVGNLPFERSTAILLKALAFPGFGAAAFMFQREVAEKITAEAGDSDFSYLSVAAQVQSGVKLLAEIPASSFSPVPEVDSSVLVFRPLQTFAGAERLEAFLNFVKHAFSHRRKTLMNSLSLGLCREKSLVKGVIESAGFDPGARPQELSVQDYLKLAAAFGEEKK